MNIQIRPVGWGDLGGSDKPPTAWKGPLGGLLTNNLTGLNIHYTIPVDLDTVVDCYARLHPCRLQLENVLQYFVWHW